MYTSSSLPFESGVCSICHRIRHFQETNVSLIKRQCNCCVFNSICHYTGRRNVMFILFLVILIAMIYLVYRYSLFPTRMHVQYQHYVRVKHALTHINWWSAILLVKQRYKTSYFSMLQLSSCISLIQKLCVVCISCCF